MLIDWFTVGAQAVNFVILVWLMKRFLYKPVLHAIDAREQRIAAELAEADAKKAEASEERAELQHKNEVFEQERSARWSQATEEASAERRRLIEEARKAADAVSAKRAETLAREAEELSRAITRHAREEVFAIARRVLKDLATTSLEAQMSEELTRRLRDMDGDSKARLGAALRTASEPVLVRSAFELPTQQRAAIQDALNVAFSAEVPVRFAPASELIGGIELTTNGQKVGWSIDDYLGALEKSAAALVGRPGRPERASKAEVASAPEGEAHEHGA